MSPTSGPTANDLSDLIDFLDHSPSTHHVVASAVRRLDASGFVEMSLRSPWTEVAARGYIVSGASLVSWSAPDASSPSQSVSSVLGSVGWHIVGAHTDSPGFRVKPRPETGNAGWKQLGVEIYGGVLLNSWLDRDLGIAGQLTTTDGHHVDVHIDASVCRIAQLAIHLDRDVNERGLVLDRQQHLTPIWGIGSPVAGEFTEWLGERTGVAAEDIAAWDLCLTERTPASVLGADTSMLASGRLDNQLSCWAAITAILTATPSSHTAVVALFDHEEVGSESASGAAGPLLEQVLERLALACGFGRSEYLAMLASSSCVSADNAHAVHPNYPERHDVDHRPMINQGPAIKLNSNQRYATSATTAAMIQRVFTRAGVPWQVFVSRNNMPCGSTIGPITATRLGIATVDVGVPQLSMHSARELCGVDDPGYLARALTAYFHG